MNHGSAWNSLVIVQVVISVMTPLAVAVLGLIVTRAVRKADARDVKLGRAYERDQWANRRAVERLIELHKELAPLLNDLMCFFRMIGHFREIDPPGALARKRQADRVFYANEHLFSTKFREMYRLLMSRYFAQWETPGQDAKIRTSSHRLREERGPGASWDDTWYRLFEVLPDSSDRRREQEDIYVQVMVAFAAELGLPRADSQATP